MSFRSFAESAICLRGQPFSLAERLYLHAVYDSKTPNLIIRASRQVEKSTLIANRMLYNAVTRPGARILFVCPRREQAHLFSRTRLQTSILESRILKRRLWKRDGRMPTENLQLDNGSEIYIRAAFHSADAIRGISADLLFIDEYQDLAPGELPVIQETLSHATAPQTVLTGTPKLIDNPLEASFSNSTACEWQVACPACHKSALLDERVLAFPDLLCPDCQHPIKASAGRWVPRNPGATWGDGFSINHLIVPWLNISDILNRQRDYDRVRFRNEVLGLPTNLGDHLITREEIEACCDSRPFVRTLGEVRPTDRQRLVAGIDWGGGSQSGTVLALGYIEANRVFQVVRFDRWQPQADPNAVVQEVADRCRQYQVRWIAADGGGNGQVYNRYLLQHLSSGARPAFYAINYSQSNQNPVQHGALWHWTVDRSGTIGTLFGRIKNRQLRFPSVAETGSFLDEFVCEVAIYDNEMRSVRYSKPDNQRDDALHATNYAEIVGLRMLHAVPS